MVVFIKFLCSFLHPGSPYPSRPFGNLHATKGLETLPSETWTTRLPKGRPPLAHLCVVFRFRRPRPPRRVLSPSLLINLFLVLLVKIPTSSELPTFHSHPPTKHFSQDTKLLTIQYIMAVGCSRSHKWRRFVPRRRGGVLKSRSWVACRPSLTMETSGRRHFRRRLKRHKENFNVEK